MKRTGLILVLAMMAGCGGSGEPAPVQSEAERVTGDLVRQSQQIARQGNELAIAAEREFESQTAIVFDKRGDPFGEGTNEAAAEDPEAEKPLGEIEPAR